MKWKSFIEYYCYGSMHIRLVFLIIGIIMTAFSNIGIITETLAQEVEDDSSSLSGQSIEKAEGNVTEGSITELTANKTGVEEDDSLSLSGQSIEEAKKEK